MSSFPYNPQSFITGASSYVNSASGQYLRRTTNLPSIGAVSMLGWGMRTASQNGSYRYFAGFESATSSAGNYFLLGWNSSNSFHLESSSISGTFASEPAVLEPFQWGITCGVASAGAGYWAKASAGSRIVSVTGTVPSMTLNELILGNDSFDEFTQIKLWNVRVWDRTLSAAEVAKEFTSSVPLDLRNLHAWWPLEGDENQLLRDWSGNGKTLTKGGSPKAGRIFVPISFYKFKPKPSYKAPATGSTFTITPSGSIAFSGTVEPIRGRQTNPSGSVTFSNTNALIKTKIQEPAGSITFNSGVTISRGRAYTPSGVITLSGTLDLIHGRQYNPSGSITFSGSETLVKTKIQLPTGSITFSGTLNLIRGRVITSSGQIVFSGTAPFVSNASYVISPTGSISFSGTLDLIHGKVYDPSGLITLSGTIALIKSKIQIPTGQIVFSGGINYLTKSSILLPAGNITFSGTNSITFTAGGAAPTIINDQRLNIKISKRMGT